MSSDDARRRVLAIASRRTSYAILCAAEAGRITRADAALANDSTPASADLVLRELLRAELLEKGPRRGRLLTYAITDMGRLTIDVVRRYEEALPPPLRAWWVTGKRGSAASPGDVLKVLAESGSSRVYRCIGDFDFVATLEDQEHMPEFLDELFERLRSVGVRQISAAHVEFSP